MLHQVPCRGAPHNAALVLTILYGEALAPKDLQDRPFSARTSVAQMAQVASAYES